MREFFKGRRRKAGLLVLFPALMVTATWIRSYAVEDSLRMTTRQATRIWSSEHRGLGYLFYLPRDPGYLHAPRFRWHSEAQPVEEVNRDLPWSWKWSALGFDLGEYNGSGAADGRLIVAIIPHWSIAVPLTVLSAYLLLLPLTRAKPSPVNSTGEKF